MYSITGYELTVAVLFVARFIDCCLQLCVYLQTTPGSVVQAAPCHPSDLDPTHQNQNFSAPALSLATASPLLSLLSGLAVDAGAVFTIGSPLTLNDVSASSNVFLNATSPPVGPNGSTGCASTQRRVSISPLRSPSRSCRAALTAKPSRRSLAPLFPARSLSLSPACGARRWASVAAVQR
jgi:hypothetical protein